MGSPYSGGEKWARGLREFVAATWIEGTVWHDRAALILTCGEATGEDPTANAVIADRNVVAPHDGANHDGPWADPSKPGLP